MTQSHKTNMREAMVNTRVTFLDVIINFEIEEIKQITKY